MQYTGGQQRYLQSSIQETGPISTAILLSFLVLALHQNPAPEASSHVYM